MDFNLKTTNIEKRKKQIVITFNLNIEQEIFKNPSRITTKHYKAQNKADETLITIKTQGGEKTTKETHSYINKTKQTKKLADILNEKLGYGLPWKKILLQINNKFAELEAKENLFKQTKQNKKKIPAKDILRKQSVQRIKPSQATVKIDKPYFIYGLTLDHGKTYAEIIINDDREIKEVNETGFQEGHKEVLFKTPLLTTETRWSKRGIHLYLNNQEHKLEKEWNQHKHNPFYNKEPEKLFNVTTTEEEEENGYTEQQITENIYNDIVGLYEHYISFPDQRDYKLLPLWVMGTYLHTLFESYPYIYLTGYKESGKTKVLNLSKKLAFNGENASNISASALYRTIEANQPSFFIDETEALSKKRGRMPEKAKEIHNVLLSGYKKGGNVKRSDKDNPDDVKNFEVYGPKMFANIRGIDEVLKSRCIEILMKRAKRNSEVMKRIIKENDPVWQQTRDRLYPWALKNWQEVKKNYEELEIDSKVLTGRKLELWRPILAVAKTIKESLYQEIKEYAKEKAREKEGESLSDAERLVIRAITEVFNKNEEKEFYRVGRIKNKIEEYMEKETNWLTPKWVSKKLRRFGFTESKHKRDGNYRKITKEGIVDAIDRYGGEEYLENVEDVVVEETVVENKGKKVFSTAKYLQKEYGEITYDSLEDELRDTDIDPREIEDIIDNLIMKDSNGLNVVDAEKGVFKFDG